MKALKKIKILLLSLISLLLILLVIVNAPIIIMNHQPSIYDYSDWMSENLNNDDNIIDISMLGAHDVFSYDINLFSKVDELSASSIMKGGVGTLIKGFSYKQSKTQISDISTLLTKGVRYLDVRLTYSDDDQIWYTVHNFYSSIFTEVMGEVVEFLQNNPGEFLIIDLQHIYDVDYDNSDDFDRVYELLDETGILDFAYHSDIKPLNQVTYGDVTSDGSQSGVVILSKFQTANSYFWSYEASIRSAWADSDDFEGILNFLREEKNLIDSGNAMTGNQVQNASNQVDSRQAFRVMQGVATMQMSGKGIVKGITSWSLIKRAKLFNDYLINQDDFTDLMSSMPIVMVDYADTNYNNFLDNIMEIIIDQNNS